MTDSRQLAYADPIALSQSAWKHFLEPRDKENVERDPGMLNKHLFSSIAVQFAALVKQPQHQEIQRAIDYIDGHYKILDSMIEVLTLTFRYQEFLKASNVKAFFRDVIGLAEYDRRYMIPLVERIYMWLSDQFSVALSKDVMRDVVIPLVVARQADRFLRSNSCHWKEVFDPRTHDEVVYLLDVVFKSRHSDDRHLAVVKDVISKQANYFFGTVGEVKKFGQYEVKIENVKYHPIDRTVKDSHLQLNLPPVARVGAMPDEASRYAKFNLKIKNEQGEIKSLVVHFFKTAEGFPVDLKNWHDLTAFCNLSEKTQSHSIWVQGAASAQLIFTAMLVNNWQLIFESDTDKMAKRCVELWDFLKRIRPDLNLLPEQFAQAVSDGARLACLAPKKTMSLIKSSLFSPSVSSSHVEMKSDTGATIIENYDPQKCVKR